MNLFTIDTNILIYSIALDNISKHEVAAKLIDFAIDARSILTMQSISEFYNVNKYKKYVPHSEACKMVDKLLSTFDIVSASPRSLCRAMDLSHLSQIQFWDAMMLTAAKEGGANLIFSKICKMLVQ